MINPFALMAEEAGLAAPAVAKPVVAKPVVAKPAVIKPPAPVTQKQVSLPKLPPDYFNFDDNDFSGDSFGSSGPYNSNFDNGVYYDSEDSTHYIWSDSDGRLERARAAVLPDPENLLYHVECQAAMAGRSGRLKILDVLLSCKDFNSLKARQHAIELWAKESTEALNYYKTFPTAQSQVRGKKFKATLRIQEDHRPHYNDIRYRAYVYLDEVPVWP